MKLGEEQVTHERRQIAIIDRHEMAALLSTAACAFANFPVGTKCEVELYEATEGSPPYKVGYNARVTMVQELGEGK